MEKRRGMSRAASIMFFADGNANVVDDEHDVRAKLPIWHNLSSCTFAAELPAEAGAGARAGAEAEPNVPLETNVQRILRSALAERCACLYDTPDQDVERSERDEYDDCRTCTRCYLRITQERMTAVRALDTPPAPVECED